MNTNSVAYNIEINKKRKRIAIILGIVAVIVLYVVGDAGRTHVTYNKAEDLIAKEEYIEAVHILRDIEDKNYKDTEALITLCNAHYSCSVGRDWLGYENLKDVEFKYQTKEQLEKIEAFKSEIRTVYYDHLSEEYEKNKVDTSIPYVGMSESRINSTTLGYHSGNIRHNHETINGKVYTANLYDFMKDGMVIFTARCVNGKVIQVWDERNSPHKPYGSYSGSGSSNKKDDDPYNATDYAHPEDFYYDHYDDFFDYEDAEDYYNEHDD